MAQERLLVVGNGMAGARVIEELLEIAPDKYAISVIGAERWGNYNRILLSQVLSGEKDFAATILNGPDWYAERGVEALLGSTATAIDRRGRTVTTSDGLRLPYDRLVLATGSSPVVPDVPGTELEGVVTFRDIADVRRMAALAENGGRAVVIGGGLLGLEAAHGLSCRGMDVTVVHLVDRLMERQLDAHAGKLLEAALRRRGMKILLPKRTTAILGDGGRVGGVRFEDGDEVAADLVVLAVGIRPNLALAQAAAIHCERGVVVSETMQTYDPRVYAVGECVQHAGNTYGLVAPIFRQAKVCANHLAELGYARFEDAAVSTKLKVSGIDLYSAGRFDGGDGCEALVMQDAGLGVYKKLVIRDDRLVGALLFGDTANESWYYELMRDGTDVGGLRSRLLFGQAHCGDSGHGAVEANVAALPDAAEICGCNGVTKGTIVKAIVEKGLFTLDEVKAHTKAAASCGSCAGKVEQILASTLGGTYSPAPKEKPLCTCTDHTHDEVRRTIREQHLTTIAGVMRYMDWRTPDGCPKCRPALNYYLIATWPGEAQDDPQSRVHNERVHANIQQDGTYAVVPRTWGGLTNAGELRAIADVAERMGVPVKITGGQRMAIPFVKKEDLPAVWAELGKAGLTSGYAYGKAVRSVKSCVGKGLCRFGTQDSLGLGIGMEKFFWGAWTPHKFKMGVSGCPRNCAEATIKDFGVVGVESGWELHVGGTCGVRVRATDLLCKVTTAEEVQEYGAAFLQLYRDEAHYLERSSAWVERVGLAYVRKRVVEDAVGRQALAGRFAEAQVHAQVDPWQERAAGAQSHEYAPLHDLAAAE